jgi:hypothetical protein
MLPSSGIQHRVAHMRTDVLEECITSIFRAKNQPNKKPVCSRLLGILITLEAIILEEYWCHKPEDLSLNTAYFLLFLAWLVFQP